jgi:hypothetical protein
MNICESKTFKNYGPASVTGPLLWRQKKMGPFPFSVLPSETWFLTHSLHCTCWSVRPECWFFSLCICRTHLHLIKCSLKVTCCEFRSESVRDQCVYFCIFMNTTHTYTFNIPPTTPWMPMTGSTTELALKRSGYYFFQFLCVLLIMGLVSRRW